MQRFHYIMILNW